MKPEHYPDLELCRKLTELGFPITEKVYCHHNLLDFITDYDEGDKVNPQYVCPSVMELLDEMPSDIHIFYCGDEWNVLQGTYKATYKDTLPSALAEMWIWLVENKYITINKK